MDPTEPFEVKVFSKHASNTTSNFLNSWYRNRNDASKFLQANQLIRTKILKRTL